MALLSHANLTWALPLQHEESTTKHKSTKGKVTSAQDLFILGFDIAV
jgi:hypothetical protein